MVAIYLTAVFAVVLLTVAAYELLMPALTRRDLLFGVTVTPSVRDSAAGALSFAATGSASPP